MTRIIGVVVLLIAIGCGVFAYLQAGGAWGSFRFDKLFEGKDAPWLTASAIGLSFLSLLMIVFGGMRKKKK